jgi:acyl-CoA reductase-like NAD-dependent aldehyde dehydrogenase
VVLKRSPAKKSPLTALRLAGLSRASLPEGVFNVDAGLATATGE